MLLRVKLSIIIIHEHCLIIFLICKNLNIHYINVYMYIKIDKYYILNNIKLYIYIYIILYYNYYFKNE